MPVVFERTFRVRYYECDASGHLNHINYLRYMETAAMEASAAVGYDQAKYDEMKRLWLVRGTEVEYLAPLYSGEQVAVRTWVERFRRVQSRRRYEFVRERDGIVAAQGYTDWAFLHHETHRPTPIPAEMRAAFMPDGQSDDLPRLGKFPQPPPEPAGTFRLRQKIEWRDIDPTHHVNNAIYLAYMENAGMGVLADNGWSMQRCWDEGFSLVARRYNIDYRGQARLGDELEISTWLSDAKRATAVRHYKITRVSDGTLVTRGRCLWVWIDIENQRPIRIPAHFVADFQDNIV